MAKTVKINPAPVKTAHAVQIPLAVFGNTPIVEKKGGKNLDEQQEIHTFTLQYMSADQRKVVFAAADEMGRSLLAASLSYFSDWINDTPHAISIAMDDKEWKNSHSAFEKATFQSLPGSWRQAKTAIRNFLTKCPSALTGDFVVCTTDGELTPLRVLKSWIPQAEKAPAQTIAQTVDSELSKDDAPLPTEFLTTLADQGTISGVDLLMSAIAKLGEGTVRQILAERANARRKEAKHLKVA